jgi:putative tryptophan/tyrosine transport system substrate-binding protein
MRRRRFITFLGGAAMFTPLSAWAQQPQPPLVGVLNAASAESNVASYEAFRALLRQLGYVEGRNIRFEYRYADGFLDRLPALAEELVRLNPSVIVSGPLPASLAARKATATIPIVMATGADPVGFGLVQSLAHPGGNVTGISNFAEELASKQLDVIRELLPGLSRVAALINVTNTLHVPQWREIQAAAAKASLTLVHFEFREPADLERAFAEFASAKAEALLVPPDTTFSSNRARIAELAAKTRLPAIYGDRRAVDSGGLLSYGPNVAENYRRSAVYVDKILRGARPADLPVEQPTKIELVINLKTAKALGLAIRPGLIERADDAPNKNPAGEGGVQSRTGPR